jgi:DNA polymerase delta subunit 1
VVLAARMRDRDPSSAPVLGDRVPYVMIKGMKGAKAFEKAEDPLYVLENKLCIDANYYLEHHLSKPITRLFAAIVSHPESLLLSGDHTRHISIPTPATTGGLMRFVKKMPSCLGCGVPVHAEGATVCAHCAPQEASICARAVADAAAKQARFAAFWTQCQRCQVNSPALFSIILTVFDTCFRKRAPCTSR